MSLRHSVYYLGDFDLIPVASTGLPWQSLSLHGSIRNDIDFPGL